MNKFKKIFGNIKIKSLAKETNFMIRRPKKITPENFLYSFYLSFSAKIFSLDTWALEFEKLTGIQITSQAIDKKLQIRHIEFYERLFEEAIKKNYTKLTSKVESKLAPFNRVLVEDSTCVKLANKLYKFFSGASNGMVKKAITRIQFSFDLKNNTYENLEMCTYTQNDGYYSEKIIKRAKEGDLVLRDLGYWNLKAFKQLVKKGVYILSRYKLSTKIYNRDKEEMDLVRHLKKLEKKGIRQVDEIVYIGREKDLKVRIIGQKLTSVQLEKKMRAAKKNAYKKRAISKRTKYLMSWNLLITNVEETIWSVKDAFQVYGFRWNIEMMFKNWKSTFKIDSLLQTTKSENPYRPRALLYLSLTYLALIFQPKFNSWYKKIKAKFDRELSPQKFGKYICQELKDFWDYTEEYLSNILLRYCCYDKRRDRNNVFELLYC